MAGLHGTKASYAAAVAQVDSLPYNGGCIRSDSCSRPGDSFRVGTIGDAKSAWGKLSNLQLPRHKC